MNETTTGDSKLDPLFKSAPFKLAIILLLPNKILSDLNNSQ